MKALSSVGGLIFLNLWLSSFSALATATFGEQEVEADSLIAVARPYGNGKYDLLVIEQLPKQRQCWQEVGSNPISVNPLLLNFDFTGICQRSTDSNGYSIRVNGEDYGLDYLFRVVEREGELWLIGSPRRNSSQPELIVGRTYGLNAGFLKISLNPGWRMTKRTIGGTPLHHIYFSAQNNNLAILPNTNSIPGNNQTILPSSIPGNNQTTLPSSIPGNNQTILPSSIPGNNQTILPSKPIKEWKFTAPTNKTTDISSGSLPLPPNTLENGIKNPTLPPNTLENGIKNPTLPPNTLENGIKNPTLPPNTSENGRKDLAELLPLPNSGNNSTTYSAPSLPKKEPVSSVFRVIVLAKNTQEQQKVKEIYPNAFSTSYKGRSALQIGRFSNRSNAESTLLNLKNAGLQGIIVQ